MRILLCISTLVLLAGAAVAQDEQQARNFDREPVRTPIEEYPLEANADAASRQLELRRAMNEEISLRVDAEQRAVADLAAQLENATTSDARQDLQRRISTAKQKGWRDLLAIQLKYAELGGHTEQAEVLRARVARLDEGLSSEQTPRTSARRDAEVSGKDGGQ